MNKDRMRILLVDDSADDINLLPLALRRARVAIDLEVLHDGHRALDYFQDLDGNSEKTAPDLVLLDLHMPISEGLEILEEIKSDPHARYTPVIIVTTSGDSSDIHAAYSRGAACYIRKPANFDDLKLLVRKLFEFWTLVDFPSEGTEVLAGYLD